MGIMDTTVSSASQQPQTRYDSAVGGLRSSAENIAADGHIWNGLPTGGRLTQDEWSPFLAEFKAAHGRTSPDAFRAGFDAMYDALGADIARAPTEQRADQLRLARNALTEAWFQTTSRVYVRGQ